MIFGSRRSGLVERKHFIFAKALPSFVKVISFQIDIWTEIISYDAQHFVISKKGDGFLEKYLILEENYFAHPGQIRDRSRPNIGP